MFKDFTISQREQMMKGFERLHDTTCVRFVEKKMHHQYFIYIVNQLELNKTTSEWIESTLCWAYIGRDHTKRYEGQKVQMAKNCFICQKEPCPAM